MTEAYTDKVDDSHLDCGAAKAGNKLSFARHLEESSILYEKQGNFRKAEAACKQALALREEKLGPKHIYLTLALDLLVTINLDAGRHEEAISYCERALAIRTNWYGEEHPSVATNVSILASLYQEQGRRKESRTFFRRAYRIRKRLYEPGHPYRLASIDDVYPKLVAILFKLVEFVRAIWRWD